MPARLSHRGRHRAGGGAGHFADQAELQFRLLTGDHLCVVPEFEPYRRCLWLSASSQRLAPRSCGRVDKVALPMASTPVSKMGRRRCASAHDMGSQDNQCSERSVQKGQLHPIGKVCDKTAPQRLTATRR